MLSSSFVRPSLLTKLLSKIFDIWCITATFLTQIIWWLQRQN